MSYFGKRYYDGEVGAWTSCDPKLQFWSPYSYVSNGWNSLNALDDDGGQIREAIYLITARTGCVIGETPLGRSVGANLSRINFQGMAFLQGYGVGATPSLGRVSTGPDAQRIGWAVKNEQNLQNLTVGLILEADQRAYQAAKLFSDSFWQLTWMFNNQVYRSTGIDFNSAPGDQPYGEVDVSWDDATYTSNRGPVVNTDDQVR